MATKKTAPRALSPAQLRKSEAEIAAYQRASKRARNAAGLIRPSAIRRLADQIAEKFQPEKIILFGSYAYGEPNVESDVDLMVIMDAGDRRAKASRICSAIDYAFPLDLLVRTPYDLSWRLEAGDWFLREVMAKGKVLYDKVNSRLDTKSKGRSGCR